jgi:4-diphosphocytidyl-2-C-methyl-D-erythritol kinase
LVIKSYAKVNLFLEVLNKRPDNYHNLNTLFERISLFDEIILTSRQDNLIKISCNNPQVPLDKTNLCFKAAQILRDKFGIKKGLNIKITKRIPVGAGLGGGSSNAASVLVALNKLWKLNLSKEKLAEFGARIGSDVPFFVYGAPFAEASGRGEKIRVIGKLNKVRLWHILVAPKVHVSTPLIYKKLDDFCGLTKAGSDVKILTSALVKKNLLKNSGLLFNSLEQVTLTLYPEVKRVKVSLARHGLSNILMSGSGSAVFALVSSGDKAAVLLKKIRKENKAWLIWVVKTV